MRISRYDDVCPCFQCTFQNTIIVRIGCHNTQSGTWGNDAAYSLRFFNDLKSYISGEAELRASKHMLEFVKDGEKSAQWMPPVRTLSRTIPGFPPKRVAEIKTFVSKTMVD